MLIDTDVLIWFLRGHKGAEKCLQVINPWHISVVTYIELLQGCRDKKEQLVLQKGLLDRGTTIEQISFEISRRAMGLIELYTRSHHLQLADALIGASALELGQKLLTANGKHFQIIPDLEVELFVP